jgi:osmotically-inducible protein OsmY
MRAATAWRLLPCFLALLGTLGGCAAYHAWRKCGLEGCPGDVQLRAEVLARLDQYPALAPPNRVYVQALDGVVYLSGQVQTDLQREDAESAAVRAVPGHRLVDNIALSYNGR